MRWLLVGISFVFLVLGMLTSVRAPAWSRWQLAVLAGEYGHWLALGCVIAGGWGWFGRGDHPVLGILTLATTLLGLIMLLKPAFQAWRLAGGLPARIAGAFHDEEFSGEEFSCLGLWLGRDPPAGQVETLNVAAGLPLDFYRSADRDGSKSPCVIVIHGGGWDSGDRRQMVPFNHWLARRGFSVAAISYRLAPAFQWPAPREDALAAIAFLKQRADELGIDPTQFVLLGRSAGGQIALTTAYGAPDPAIRGVVGLYTPSDLIFGYVNTHENDMLKSPALLRKYLGGTPDSARANYESASAYFHVTAQTPPTLLLHGENDALVWHRHSVRLAERLHARGRVHVFVSLPWATHAFDYNFNGPGGQLTRMALDQFLRRVTTTVPRVPDRR